MNILARWRLHREIRKTKCELAALYRRYDKVCSRPGHTSVFTADEIGDLGYQIGMAVYRLRLLNKELHHGKSDPDPDGGTVGGLR